MNDNLKDYLNVSVYKYLEKISEPTAIPSGGAAFGLTGALSSSLATMIANLSSLNKKIQGLKEVNSSMAELFSYGTKAFEKIIEQDMTAYLLLREDIADKSLDKHTRKQRIKNSLMRACEPPMLFIQTASKLANSLEVLNLTCSDSLHSDIGVSACLLESAVNSSWITILVNLNSIQNPDQTFLLEIESTKEKKDSTIELLQKLFTDVEKKLENDI